MKNITEYADLYDINEPSNEQIDQENKSIYVDGFSLSEMILMNNLVNDLYYSYEQHLKNEVANGVILNKSIPEHLLKLNQLLNSSSVLKSIAEE